MREREQRERDSRGSPVRHKSKLGRTATHHYRFHPCTCLLLRYLLLNTGHVPFLLVALLSHVPFNSRCSCRTITRIYAFDEAYRSKCASLSSPVIHRQIIKIYLINNHAELSWRSIYIYIVGCSLSQPAWEKANNKWKRKTRSTRIMMFDKKESITISRRGVVLRFTFESSRNI